MDLRATSGLVLTQSMGIQAISTDLQGPLPKDSVGVILGRSSSTMRGLLVLPGVIDPDYQGTIKVMCHSPFGIVSIAPGDRIAQMILMPSLHARFPAQDKVRGKGGFGSSGVDMACLSLELDDRPMCVLEIEGKEFSGLIDTGADRSVMSRQFWPKNWPLQKATQTLQGLGYQNIPDMSAKTLQWTMEDQRGSFQPFVLDLPLNLWGRDVQRQLRLVLTNEHEYSEASRKMMIQQGYVPGAGLGSHLQGRAEPIVPSIKQDRKGLGFS